jgi:ABC-type multidrug transport system ATPase subunit/ABC-type multidrug transport system permease subunit
VSDNTAGLRIEARSLTQWVGRDRVVLHDVSLTIEPGELVAVLGASGAGKTTLLDALAGVRPPKAGTVRYGGKPQTPTSGRDGEFGYVPQDDIIHRELPLGRTLRYAAKLRLPAGTARSDLTAIVDEALATLDLTDRAGTPVGRLSGGERKRASIAVELLTRPRVLFADEPTSGFDPALAVDFVAQLRAIADIGSTVVFTTHNPADVGPCDKVVVLTPDGRLAYVGTPDAAKRFFGTDSITEIYRHLSDVDSASDWVEEFAKSTPDGARAASKADDADVPEPPKRPGPVGQWWLLTRRNADLLAGNRLTLAILLGCPLAVLLMIVVLFRPHAFDPAAPSPNATAQICFWVAFGTFFFGLTYGLLQIVTETAVLRRERYVVLRLGPYLLGKLAVLLPLLAVVDAAMLAVLRGTDRLPALDVRTYGSLLVTMVFASAASLAIGLLASAAVREAGQATLTLPMLCFPQVLFSGAILPVPVMAAVGRWISYPMSNRWAFEALGHDTGLPALWSTGRSPLGPPLLASFGDTFTRAVAVDWAVLAGFTAVFLAAAWAVLDRRLSSAAAG